MLCVCGTGALLCLVGNELDSEVHSRCVTFCLVSTSVAVKTKKQLRNAAVTQH